MKQAGKLHELLAVEKTRVGAVHKLIAETIAKFGKFDYFQGAIKTLKMIEDSPQNAAIEAAAAETRMLPTTVHETLEYLMEHWVRAEDVIFQKNVSNQYAIADLYFRDEVIVAAVPVDELMGLEVRLEQLRKMLENMPTLSAAIRWVPDSLSGRKGAWVAADAENTTKTEKTTTPVVLYAATDKHPAQVEKVSSDKTVGIFTLIKTCGAATSAQKAAVMANLDELISEVKQARMRANSVDAAKNTIGEKLAQIVLEPFNK